MEHPEYLICPVCKEKIKLNYNIKRSLQIQGITKTEDIIVIGIRLPLLKRPSKKKAYTIVYRSVIVCKHCNGIIGIS